MLTETATTTKSKILLVDDHEPNLLVLETLLDDPDLELFSAHSGQEALATILHHDFVLVLLDVHMPNMDGFEVAKLMRGNPLTRHIPIIFITAASKEDCEFRGYSAGAVDYLRKPLDPNILRSKVRVFCDLHQQREVIANQLEEIRENTARLEREVQGRRNAEHLFAASEERFRSFMQHLPAATSIQDRDGAYVYVNESFGEVVQRPPEACLGKKDADLWPADFAGRLRNLESSSKGCAEFENGEVIELAEQGRAFLVLRFPVFAKREKALVGTVALDITLRKHLEHELAQTRKMEAVGQLAAGVAHEINTPLQFVGDNTSFLGEAFQDVCKAFAEYEALLGTTSELSVEEIRDRVGAVREELEIDYLIEECPRAIEQSLEGLQRATGIVRAMRAFSHPGEQLVRINIQDAIQNTMIICRNEWRYVAEIHTDFEADMPSVPCYPGELNQVFVNLITNSAQALQERNEREGLKQGEIHISTRLDDDHLQITLKDNGPGIPKKIQTEVFNPFFTTKEVGKGTGQGLSLAHSIIVQKHHGTISLESEPDQGTTFVIRLPLHETSE